MKIKVRVLIENSNGMACCHPFYRRLKYDVKSTSLTTHSQLSEEELLDHGIKPNTIRLSIGIEKVEDLISALDEAFRSI